MALLLTPREREAERQKEQERLAREFGTLGHNVDKLRELEQSNKQRLQQFQEKAFAQFQEEQRSRKEQLARLDEDIARKQAEWAKLLEPLDKQFALYVRTERKNIEDEQARQASLAAKLDVQSKIQAQTHEQHAKRSLELAQEASQVATLKEKALREAQQASEVLVNAQNNAAELVSKAEGEKKTADEVLNQARTTLREAQLRQEALDKREQELEDRELAVIVEELKWYSPVKKPLQAKKPL